MSARKKIAVFPEPGAVGPVMNLIGICQGLRELGCHGHAADDLAIRVGEVDLGQQVCHVFDGQVGSHLARLDARSQDLLEKLP